MKRVFSLLLVFMLLLCLPVFAEESVQARIDSTFVGVWIENTGYGMLTIRLDGTSTMVYYDNTVTECHWELTEDGAKFTDGMWLNSPMKLLDENTLSVADGWMICTREGFLPTTDQALLLGATPVGEEGEPYLGEWTLVTLDLDGEQIDPALLGISMTLTFNADGTVICDDSLEPYTTIWGVSYGSAVVEGDIFTINEEGMLVMADGNDAMLFARNSVVSSEEPSEAEQMLALLTLLAQMEEEELSALPEELRSFVGEWHLCYLATGGLTGDLRSVGVTGTLVLDADGFGALTGLADETGDWHEGEDGVVRFGESGTPMFLLGDPDDGTGLFLQYGSEAGGYMIFHQDEEAAWVPGLYPLQPTTEASDSIASDQSVNSGTDHTGIRFTCTSYTAAGFTMDASTLGTEYALFFRADGTADLTLAGFTIENLPYAITDDGMYAINYYGTTFNCTPTASGFDMDYYGTMTMHFVPAE